MNQRRGKCFFQDMILISWKVSFIIPDLNFDTLKKNGTWQLKFNKGILKSMTILE